MDDDIGLQWEERMRLIWADAMRFGFVFTATGVLLDLVGAAAAGDKLGHDAADGIPRRAAEYLMELLNDTDGSTLAEWKQCVRTDQIGAFSRAHKFAIAARAKVRAEQGEQD